MRRVYVTGLGIVSALGTGLAANRSALLSGKSGIGFSRRIPSLHKDHLPVGEIAESTDELFSILPKAGNLFRNRILAIAALALQEALQDDAPAQYGSRMGFINASSVGGMGDVETIYEDLVDPGNHDPAISKMGESLDCAHCTLELARHFSIGGLNATISTACSSSANALIYGARLIKGGLLDGAIVGGADSLTRFTLNGFHSLKNIDSNRCRPFDAARNGLNLGEGAAYLRLESEELLQKSGNTPLAILGGYCNYNEAFHATAPSPKGDGAYLAMQGAIKSAGLHPSAISYVNAHGTATLSNDIAEGMAMHRLFPEGIPLFSSTKSYTGHTLAAAGAIEAVFSILSILQKEIYPVLFFDQPMQELPIIPVTGILKKVPVQHILSNSFGFGGNNASLLFSANA